MRLRPARRHWLLPQPGATTRLASLKTFIELTFGPRVLGALVTEGLGEVFPDGYFNRGRESERVGNGRR
jgi:hypothetical protein